MDCEEITPSVSTSAIANLSPDCPDVIHTAFVSVVFSFWIGKNNVLNTVPKVTAVPSQPGVSFDVFRCM